MKSGTASSLLAVVVGASGASAVDISGITGTKFLSPYNGQGVTDVTGVVTAKGSQGIYIRQPERNSDDRVSSSLYVYSYSLADNSTVEVGDTVTLDGDVSEYRSDDTYLYSLELGSPHVTGLVKGGGQPEPLVIGEDTLDPPTTQFTSLDGGDIFAVPNNQTQVSAVNPTLDPKEYGLDFWESLSAELVTVKSPVAISKPNSYNEIWVRGGDWPATGVNGRGGLTLSKDDANPESIVVGSPLDGSDNSADLKIGDEIDDVTGIVHYQYGFYYLLPTTKLNRISSATPALPPPTSLVSDGLCSGLTIGDYNVENFHPSDVQAVASHVANYMRTPDLLFLQEIQDNDGPTDDGVVATNETLAALADAVRSQSGVSYAWAEIDPVNDRDGGEPGGNIRVAYLYRPDVVRLRNPNPGSATQANQVLPGPALKYNPGRIDPSSAAWTDSRVPLVAQWETVDGGNPFFTVNVHWESKGGSTSLQGDPRPPVNLGVQERDAQAKATAAFVADIIAEDSGAYIIAAGDFNEYSVVEPVTDFKQQSGPQDLDVVAGIAVDERYTYTYQMDMEELDHFFVRPALAEKAPQEEHIHVNTWVSYADQVSDHDPSVAKVNVCT